jgi:predicted pyridoxine 5'-phosphate oxidase superfamily flavin-nucleotide-binding protein
MLKKFSIDYIAMPRHNSRVFTHLTDDPVEAEEFLMHLLSARSRIKEIRHDGVILTGHQFDKMVKVAAERVASRMLAEALAVDGAEIKGRFGFAA